MNLGEIRDSYIANGYDILDASSKAAQEVVLSKIAKSELSKNVTIKGGVIIQFISQDKRRATRDFDFDFIRYSLTDDSIRNFIDMLNNVGDSVAITIVAPITELKHQDYNGKRVLIELDDRFGNKIGTKLDIGIHNKADIAQEEHCFELRSVGDNVTLFMNSKEQMIAEKLASLLILGRFSTRYKDLFDIYYFITASNLDKTKLARCINEFVLEAEDMREASMSDIVLRLSEIFRNKAYLKKADTAHNNWIEIPIDEVTTKILDYFKDGIESYTAT
jgi:hypothetical protein